MISKRLLLYSLICSCFGYLSFSQKSDDRIRITSKIDSVIENSIIKQAFPGAVLLIASSDSILHHKAYGYHTYDSARAVQLHHLYDLASVTKVTAGALALMKLYDQGLLDLDAPLAQYVEGFKFNKRGKTTLRRLLSHAAGWQSWIAYYQEMIDKDGAYKKRFFATNYSEKYKVQVADSLFFTSQGYKYIKKKIKKAQLSVDQSYVYSGLFSYLIPELIQNVTGQSMEQFLQDQFYHPLKAKTLGFNPLDKYADSLIVPTEIDTFFRQQPIHGRVHDEGAILMNGLSANAGLFGSALDVYAVWNMLLNNGHSDSTYLSAQTVDLFTTVQYPNEGNRRGLGFDKPLLTYDPEKSSVAKRASYRSFGHSGYTGPLVWADPDEGLLFIFLCNRVYPNRLQRNIYKLNVRPTLHKLSYELKDSYRLNYLE